MGHPRPITVGGIQGRSISLQSTSPFPDSSGEQQNEQDWLVTVPQRNGSVIFLVFVAILGSLLSGPGPGGKPYRSRTGWSVIRLARGLRLSVTPESEFRPFQRNPRNDAEERAVLVTLQMSK